MINPTIVSLAVLKVNYDKGKDYLDNFLPIITECIRLSETDIVSIPEIQSILRSDFGLSIPQHTIKNILIRVKKKGFIYNHEGAFKKVIEKFEKLEFNKTKKEVLAKHEALIDKLIRFCSERLNITWNTDDAEKAIEQYLDEHNYLTLFFTGIENPKMIAQSIHKNARYIVAAFIKHLQDTQSAGFEYFETIVKGHMLANAIFLIEPGKKDKKFKKTEIYFDTSFLINSLGYSGEARQAPCAELLELLYETGASLCCFKHTVDEIKGILDACLRQITRGTFKESYGPSFQYFMSQRYSVSDIELFLIRLENNLESLRIDIKEKPSYENHDSIIDEVALTDKLDKRILYSTDNALLRDVDSISAIVRLREGEEFYSIEDCKAIFVTPNKKLTRIARQFSIPTNYSLAIPACITDYNLTNLLWLKKPTKAPDLPKKRIIADYYAAVQPSDQLWIRYIEEITRLKESGKVEPDDYYMLRYTMEARNALMEVTLGDDDAFTYESVEEIINLVKMRILKSTKDELEAERKLRKDAEDAIRESNAFEHERTLAIRRKAKRIASLVASLLKYVVLILLIIGIASTFPWGLPNIKASVVKYTLVLIQFLLLIDTVANLYWGKILSSLVRKFEISLSKWIEKKLLSLVNF